MSDSSHNSWKLVSFGDKISSVIRMISMSAGQLWRLGAVLLVAGLLSGAVVTMLSSAGDGNAFIAIVLMIPIAVLFAAFIPAMVIMLHQTITQGVVPSWRDALRSGFSTIGPVIVASLLYTLIQFVIFMAALLLVFLLALILGADIDNNNALIGFVNLFGVIIFPIIDGYVGFYLLAVILHQKRGVEALRYSYQIVKGRWFHVLFNKIGIAIVVYMVVVIGMVISFIPRIFSGGSLYDTGVLGIIVGFGFDLFNIVSVVVAGIAYLGFLMVLYMSLHDAYEQRMTPQTHE